MQIRYIFVFVTTLLLFASCKQAIDQSSHEKTTETQHALSTSLAVSTTVPIVEKTILDPMITDEHLLGRFIPEKHTDFVKIERKYADKADRYMHKDAYAAFLKMHKAAAVDGVQLIIKSATRNFDYQKQIWEGKWDGKRLLEGVENAAKKYPNSKDRALKILEYSSMPSTSRHHWGTDIDLNAFVNSYFEKGKGLKEYEWLVNNAHKFGFCQPYTAKGKDRPDGYNEEKWHWSYLPLSKKLTEQYKLRFQNNDIKGFKGAESAEEIDVINKYVLGISSACLH